MSVYPNRGQSQAQQQKDMGECYAWAKQSTGIDPEQLAAEPQQPQAQPHAGAGRGAAGGAAIGAMAGNPGAGAAAGAAAGGMRRRSQEREIAKEGQAAGQQKQAQLNQFNSAKKACLKGRGYTVE